MKTVLITGCSTGFGRDTALHFLNQGWRVVATMRNPAASTLPTSDRLHILPLDVTDADSIAAAIGQAGAIDVLVNNAGMGWLNAVEGSPLETVREVFETNLFGAIAMMQAVLPGMRERRSGVVVNVSSSSLYKPLPLLSVYRASKAAMNALSESAAHELAPFGIRVRVVMPGMAPSTSFGSTAQGHVADAGGFAEPYADYARQTLATMMEAANGPVTEAQDVADAIFRAATDADCPAVLPAGADAIAWAEVK
ncbi:SDR family NAD(P)-dependent oxidoreductase [Novosphingobium aerophilum]|uniref:SDR family NAD(P)-dependent oxidoreductase n=1 Tax=Novosphingobium TaxID=165696 RepID=UPI002D798CE4|nr:SDR family NAD(P)-dependent oxidoreductase [Novosphingobium sp. RL4]WRT95196.1 SDR family NAD(P)-dependent oxidoreductase [Novosphingobium sp. RL4]